jgi:lysylphosphatidylglycerol synthetase-like protein (DUF2156 family)
MKKLLISFKYALDTHADTWRRFIVEVVTNMFMIVFVCRANSLHWTRAKKKKFMLIVHVLLILVCVTNILSFLSLLAWFQVVMLVWWHMVWLIRKCVTRVQLSEGYCNQELVSPSWFNWLNIHSFIYLIAITHQELYVAVCQSVSPYHIYRVIGWLAAQWVGAMSYQIISFNIQFY